jgi:ACR3 family arsenite efflux pump ArsB
VTAPAGTPTHATAADERHVAARLSTLDRFLPVRILAAMAAGLLWGGWCPGWATP